MNLHEYQAKHLLQKHGIMVPQGRMVHTVDEAVQSVRPLLENSSYKVLIVKAQIHAGGRGKGSFLEDSHLPGINVVPTDLQQGVKSAEEQVRDLARRMLGSTLVTTQTGHEGKLVNRLYIEQGVEIRRELYISIVLDRKQHRNMVLALDQGGTAVEELASANPSRLLKETIDPALGLLPFQAHALSWKLGLRGNSLRNCSTFISRVSRLAETVDSDLIELNPVVVTQDDEVIALDAKFSIDDNSLFRQKDLLELRDLSEEDPAEIEASKYELNFIKLTGNIGCLVNGAGLAMATMDMIKQVGGEPANFLDVGGSASTENVTAAFKIITQDPKVRGIFVNIFGGIMRCDVIANGIVEAVMQTGLKVPLVVRLEGTNADLGRQIINASGLNVISASEMKDGAVQIVRLSQ